MRIYELLYILLIIHINYTDKCIFTHFRYRCEQCSFDSEKRRVMFEHIRSLHVDSSEIWKCDLCQFETMYKCNLVNHMKKMHNNDAEISNHQLRPGQKKHTYDDNPT